MDDHGSRGSFPLPLRALASLLPAGFHGTVVLDAVFHGARGTPSGLVETPGLELDAVHPVSRPDPHILRFAFRWPQQTTEADIRVASVQPLELVKFVVRDRNSDVLGIVEQPPGDREPALYLPDSEDFEERANLLDPEAYLVAVERHLETLEPDERTTGRRFFAELDREANPFLLRGQVRLGRMHREDAVQRGWTMEAIGNELRRRVEQRCQGLDEARGCCPSLQDRVFEHLRLRCASVSRLILGSIDRHFGNDLAAFERAFTCFANGELRMRLPSLAFTTQPSSANFFLFGEFALMAADYGIESARWSALANVMVRAQVIFAEVYAPSSLDGANFLTYSGHDYVRNGKPYSEEAIEALRTRFRGADLRLEAARNASRAMPGLRA